MDGLGRRYEKPAGLLISGMGVTLYKSKLLIEDDARGAPNRLRTRIGLASVDGLYAGKHFLR